MEELKEKLKAIENVYSALRPVLSELKDLTEDQKEVIRMSLLSLDSILK